MLLYTEEQRYTVPIASKLVLRREQRPCTLQEHEPVGKLGPVCGTALPAELGGRRSGLNGLRLCGQDFTGQSQVWQGSYNRKLWPFESTKLIVSLSWPNCTPGLYCNLGDEIINTKRVCQEQLRSWLQGRQAKSPTPRIREMLGSQLKILGPWPPF